MLSFRYICLMIVLQKESHCISSDYSVAESCQYQSLSAFKRVIPGSVRETVIGIKKVFVMKLKKEILSLAVGSQATLSLYYEIQVAKYAHL